MITEEQIQAVVQRIVEGYAPDKIYLFGAYAYGVPTEDSDLDLLVLKSGIGPTREGRALAVRRLVRSTGIPMDVLVRTPAEIERAAGSFYSVETIAVKQGRLLYANT